jgi:16S rRNA (adenine1518-N6/adenine1519-N6)-dimethyltransferase
MPPRPAPVTPATASDANPDGAAGAAGTDGAAGADGADGAAGAAEGVAAASPEGLPPIRETIRAHGLSARKALGQNFILDLNITAKVARAAGDLAGKTVLEVGPGPGALTRSLLAAGADVVAIERDRRCIAALEELAARYPGRRLEIVEGDALKLDIAARLPADGGVRVVSNLPYNIGTALLVRWLGAEPWPPWWHSLTLMFQREVAERIVAAPRTRAYGRLGVIAQWRSRAARLFDLPPTAFVPPPKVWSSLVRIVPDAAPEGVRGAAISRITAAAFGQRRKMLRASLKPLGPDPLALLGAAGIDPTARAEELAIADFVRLAAALDRA